MNPDEIKVPATVEEFQKALREAFAKGAWWGLSPSGSPGADTLAEARKRYPIRKKVPRVVTVPRLAGGEREVKVVDGEFWVRQPGDWKWVRQYAVITDGTVRTLYDLLENPFTYEEE